MSVLPSPVRTYRPSSSRSVTQTRSASRGISRLLIALTVALTSSEAPSRSPARDRNASRSSRRFCESTSVHVPTHASTSPRFPRAGTALTRNQRYRPVAPSRNRYSAANGSPVRTLPRHRSRMLICCSGWMAARHPPSREPLRS